MAILKNLLDLTVKKLLFLVILLLCSAFVLYISIFGFKQYSFEITRSFPIRKWTNNLEVDYYVKENFQIDESKLADFEHSIEREHFKNLEKRCNNDIWSFRRQKHPDTPYSCRKLAKDYSKLDKKCNEEIENRAILAKEAEETHGWRSQEYQSLIQQKLPSCQIKNEIVDNYKKQGDFADPVQKVNEYKLL